ncbi:MAG: zf-HC2 domain-containing protein [Methylococcaceae bacterium]
MTQQTYAPNDLHHQIQLLLPWYLNKSLAKDEQQRVESHLRNCIRCSQELFVLRKLAAAVNESSDLEVAAEVSFAGLRGQLHAAYLTRDKSVSSNNQTRPVLSRKPANTAASQLGNLPNRGIRLSRFKGFKVTHFAIAASLLLTIIPLVMHYGRLPTTTDYYTLSAAKPESPTGTKLRIVFSKSLLNADMDLLLEKIDGQLVEGPNSVGAYTVRLGVDQNSDELTAVIALLRNQQNVLLVEPVIEP